MAVSTLRAGVIRPTAPAERRVAVVPAAVSGLTGAGFEVLVQAGAGTGARFGDEDYTDAGASVLSAEEVYARSDVLLAVTVPDPTELHGRLRPGQALVGLLRPLAEPRLVGDLAAAGATAISLDGVPRNLSRAQSMDALTSQASVAGYKAVIVAAAAYDRYLPLLMTAAGVARPAQVLVLGAGVAGLQAIATAHRLGAVVSGYDVRPEAQDEIRSLGADTLRLPAVTRATATGGYARALTGDEQQAQREALAAILGRFDIVIATAQALGGRPPLLIDAAALGALRPGAVVVDLASGPRGGNVHGSRPDATVETEKGVTVIGAADLAATVPRAASEAYARNITALLRHIVREGELHIDLDDEIQAGVVITHGGRVVHPGAAAAVAELGAEPGEPGPAADPMPEGDGHGARSA
ncbi:NAD(P) transhydrogenase subunit alpha [Nocardiopsis mwathae]|uniref:proton-translocating NAD(P)(+) transhydrogenase n=1 Tax=Nocardiopsis mwathae TaxID=1472723 RepID=A0A7X0D4D6_9ACTN|nr:NAD(P) transhydrogenase subunit alpha [Nocardiopsis mwathae]MBB6170975.1 NAD(P) transhydrogenase subunit alpha [Nocardiopsis mwathae]